MDAEGAAGAAGWQLLVAILLLSSCCTVGPNGVRDMYNVLQPVLTRAPNCTDEQLTSGADCCHDCMGIGDQNYNIMFSMIFWCSAISLPAFGFLSDKFGNSVVIPIALSTVLGACLFAVGGCLRQQPTVSLASMMAGSALVGFGFYSSVVARDRIMAAWFSGSRWLGLAFGISSGINRLASLATFGLTTKLHEWLGLQLTLWVAAAVAAVGLGAAVGVSVVDAFWARRLRLSDSLRQEQKEMRLTDLRRLGVEFWLLMLIYTSSSSGHNNLRDNLTEYLHEKYSFDRETASVIAGSVRTVGAVAAPLTGLALYTFGRAAYGVAISYFLLVPSLLLLSVAPVHPAIGICLMGTFNCAVYITYSSAMAQVTPRATSGTGFAISFCSFAVTTGILHAILGAVLGHERNLPMALKLPRWNTFMLIILLVFVAGLCFAAALLFISVKKGGILTNPRPDAAAKEYENLSDGEK